VRETGLLGRFGGHAMAAGLALDPSQLERFTRAFARLAAERLDAAALRAEVWSDGELARDEITRDLAEQLRLAGPWGQGFPEPVFDGEFEVLESRVVGETHLKLRLQARRRRRRRSTRSSSAAGAAYARKGDSASGLPAGSR
jgi:single-stranded-DNA-specific exonuclease